MKNALNSAAVMLLCMFSLFFVQPDLLYVTAFLLAEETRTREVLEAELRRTQDDSTERRLCPSTVSTALTCFS